MPIIETAQGWAIAPPRGLVKVQLFDARTGKEKERIEAENFVGPNVATWQNYIQRVLYLQLANSAVNFPSGSFNNLNFGYYHSYPAVPSHIVAYSSTDAEDAATEEFFKGELIAWAACDATYSGGDTQRGTFVQASAEMTATTAKWVFTWPVASGNGTIGSIGWTTLDTSTANKGLQQAFCDRDTVTAGVQTDTTTIGLDFDGTYFRSAKLTAAASRSVYKLTTAGALDSTLTCTGGTGANCYGLAWDSATSTMRLLTAASSGTETAWNIERYATGGGAMVSSISVTLGVASRLRGITFDGTDFWVTNQTTNEILRINTSGTVTATLANPMLRSTTGTTIGIAYLNPNLVVLASSGSEMVCINTSGTAQWRSLGGTQATNQTYGSTASQIDLGQRYSKFDISTNVHTSSSAAYFQKAVGAAPWSPPVGDICIRSSQIYGQGTSGGSQYYGRIRPYGLWSRTLLGTPVTKTSSETMTISYTWAFA